MDAHYPLGNLRWRPSYFFVSPPSLRCDSSAKRVSRVRHLQECCIFENSKPKREEEEEEEEEASLVV
jgi:hypothetical protein